MTWIIGSAITAIGLIIAAKIYSNGMKQRHSCARGMCKWQSSGKCWHDCPCINDAGYCAAFEERDD